MWGTVATATAADIALIAFRVVPTSTAAVIAAVAIVLPITAQAALGVIRAENRRTRRHTDESNAGTESRIAEKIEKTFSGTLDDHSKRLRQLEKQGGRHEVRLVDVEEALPRLECSFQEQIAALRDELKSDIANTWVTRLRTRESNVTPFQRDHDN
ncbi:MAG: hypothetical protein HOV79_00395 [Hamadaea sp.]|nr:hypothetical protein [Hamadaea sp.]